MRKPSLLVSVLLGTSFALASAACSSSSSGGGVGTANDQVYTTTFAGWCTGTLLTKQELLLPMEGGGWLGDGSKSAAPGTTILVSPQFSGVWGGFVIQSDGTPAKIDGDFTKGLVKGTDFTSSCAADAALQPGQSHDVVLADATLNSSMDLSGKSCTLKAGTQLTQESYEGSSGSVAQLASAEVTKTCGFDKGYAKQIELGALIPAK